MRTNMEIKKRLGLTISLVLFIFGVMLTAMLLTALVFLLLHYTGTVPIWRSARPGHNGGVLRIGIIAGMAAFSILLGTAIAGFLSRNALNPIRKVIAATHKVAEGDFSMRLELKGIHELEELSHSFNRMAHELSTIETLRGDFINNFSHEFKTPIVSVRGFAKLLRDGNLTESERQEYLDIIIAESERLASLSTNILNLSKYENTEIITDKSPFRLDEQIRRAVVLAEPKWAAKEIVINLDLDEITYNGSEDLTQQVWLNLIDNAIKFSHRHGTVGIRLYREGSGICFTIRDEGIGMNDETKTRIFTKFYQGDISRVKSGNGLGLAIAQRIVQLCGGSIGLRSEEGTGSTFIVVLPE